MVTGKHRRRPHVRFDDGSSTSRPIPRDGVVGVSQLSSRSGPSLLLRAARRAGGRMSGTVRWRRSVPRPGPPHPTHSARDGVQAVHAPNSTHGSPLNLRRATHRLRSPRCSPRPTPVGGGFVKIRAIPGTPAPPPSTGGLQHPDLLHAGQAEERQRRLHGQGDPEHGVPDDRPGQRRVRRGAGTVHGLPALAAVDCAAGTCNLNASAVPSCRLRPRGSGRDPSLLGEPQGRRREASIGTPTCGPNCGPRREGLHASGVFAP